MKETKKNALSSPLLIAKGKSSRLDAIRNRAKPEGDTELDSKQKPQVFVSGLNKQTLGALKQAKATVDERLDSIMNTYPAGKKKTFFKLKYGISGDKVKLLVIKDMFKLLGLETKEIQYFSLIEGLDLNGKGGFLG